MQPDWKLGLLPMSPGFDAKAAPSSNGMNGARRIGTGAAACAQARDPRCSVESPLSHGRDVQALRRRAPRRAVVPLVVDLNDSSRSRLDLDFLPDSAKRGGRKPGGMPCVR